MEKRGKLYIFFGASGSGKDYMMKSFIEYGSKNNIPVKECKRYFTRDARINEQNDEFHQYGLKEEEVCTEDNFYARVNDAYIGINVNDIESNLANGNNLVFGTASVDMINQLDNSNFSNDLCLIYVTVPGLDYKFYMDLEAKRNPKTDIKTHMDDVETRYKQSIIVKDYYDEDPNRFDYAYLNMTKFANEDTVLKFGDVFFKNFFEKVINNEKEDGPNWIGIENKRDSYKK